MTVRVNIPGHGVKVFPAGTPEEVIQAESARLYQEAKSRPGTRDGGGVMGTLSDGLSEKLWNTTAQVPRAVGDVLAGAAAAVKRGPDLLGALASARSGRPQNPFGEEFTEEFRRQQSVGPAAALHGLSESLPEYSRAVGFGDSVRAGSGFGGVSEHEQAFKGQREAQAEENPVADKVAEYLGVAAELMILRSPVTRARKDIVADANQRLKDKLDAFYEEYNRPSKRALDDSFSRFFERLVKESGARNPTTAKKIAEAGTEGATIALLENGDPLEMAAFAAGTQAAGSATLFLTQKAYKHTGPFLLGAYLLNETINSIGPGAQDFFESKDFAVHKWLTAMSLGLTAGLAGAGRIRHDALRKWPVALSSLTSVPRNSLQAAFSDFRESQIVRDVMSAASQDPGLFNDNHVRALDRAFKNGNLEQEVRRLMSVPSFRESMNKYRKDKDE